MLIGNRKVFFINNILCKKSNKGECSWQLLLEQMLLEAS